MAVASAWTPMARRSTAPHGDLAAQSEDDADSRGTAGAGDEEEQKPTAGTITGATLPRPAARIAAGADRQGGALIGAASRPARSRR